MDRGHQGRLCVSAEGVCTSLKMSPPVYASGPASAGLFFGSVVVHISKSGSSDEMQSYRSTSKPEKSLEEALEAAADLAIHLL